MVTFHKCLTTQFQRLDSSWSTQRFVNKEPERESKNESESERGERDRQPESYFSSHFVVSSLSDVGVSETSLFIEGDYPIIHKRVGLKSNRRSRGLISHRDGTDT